MLIGRARECASLVRSSVECGGGPSCATTCPDSLQLIHAPQVEQRIKWPPSLGSIRPAQRLLYECKGTMCYQDAAYSWVYESRRKNTRLCLLTKKRWQFDAVAPLNFLWRLVLSAPDSAQSRNCGRRVSYNVSWNLLQILSESALRHKSLSEARSGNEGQYSW